MSEPSDAEHQLEQLILDPDFGAEPCIWRVENRSLWGDVPISDDLRVALHVWCEEWEVGCYYNREKWVSEDARHAWENSSWKVLADVNAELVPQSLVVWPGFETGKGTLSSRAPKLGSQANIGILSANELIDAINVELADRGIPLISHVPK